MQRFRNNTSRLIAAAVLAVYLAATLLTSAAHLHVEGEHAACGAAHDHAHHLAADHGHSDCDGHGHSHAPASSHSHSHSDSDEAPADDCAVCRFLALQATEPPAPAILVTPRRGDDIVVSLPEAAARCVARLHRSRAPPTQG